ncbi:SDR family NAD(P)-dependent oxidoreductase [Nocardia sp. NPDC058176]|uniref:SDR family NAD(P)-dependent oxidoreductase n=1 Tax=Nocardia sp. NPDC058176 TaxID=3346368 RepID=UPI0036DA9961
MTTIAIIGAGPGLGLATARRFGREWFSVALISRSQNKLDRLVDELAADATTAAGYPADVQNRTTLAAALDKDSSELGPIEVLQYSPVPARNSCDPSSTPPPRTSPPRPNSPSSAPSPPSNRYSTE